MGFRFRKSFKIAPGVRLNLSKSGIGMSAGVRGARIGMNSRGTYTSVGIPGTGISAMEYHGTKSRGPRTAAIAEAPVSPHILNRKIKTKTGTGLGWIIGISIASFFIHPAVAVFVLVVGTIWYFVSIKKQPSFKPKKALAAAEAAYNAKQYEKAVAGYEEAYAFFKDDKGIAVRLAFSYSKLGQMDKVAKYFADYLSVYPQDVDVQQALAEAYSNTGREDEALQILQSLDPEQTKDTPTLLMMGSILEKKGLNDAAIEVLKRAPLTKRPLTLDLVEVIYALGLLYEKTGDKRKAKSSFERVYAYDAFFKEVATKITS